MFLFVRISYDRGVRAIVKSDTETHRKSCVNIIHSFLIYVVVQLLFVLVSTVVGCTVGVDFVLRRIVFFKY